MSAEHGYIVFTDLKSFSKLTEKEVKVFYSTVLKDLSNEIIDFKKQSLVWNTWGDALVAIIKDEEVFIDLVFTYRDFFRKYEFKNIPILKPRIACHFGRFELYNDPLIGVKNALGQNINTTARIEPITRANEIFVTQDFKNAILKSPHRSNIDVDFDTLGEIPLAKNFDTICLYRLRKKDEESQIIDEILQQDISTILPESSSITSDEKKEIKSLLKSSSSGELLKSIQIDKLLKTQTRSDNYLLEIAKICKNFGLFDEALKIIDKIKNQETIIDETSMALFKYNKDCMKLEANCLTRIGKYKEASNLIYGVFQLGDKTSDTLSMLAAQYKRQAIFDKNNILLPYNNINRNLLNRSLSLYVEAFRLNIEDYYSAINVAYLHKLMGDNKKAERLAKYIEKIHNSSENKDWWLDTTLLECKIIIGDFDGLGMEFNQLIKICSPSFFHKKTTYIQIEIYSKIMGLDKKLFDVLEALKVG